MIEDDTLNELIFEEYKRGVLGEMTVGDAGLGDPGPGPFPSGDSGWSSDLLYAPHDNRKPKAFKIVNKKRKIKGKKKRKNKKNKKNKILVQKRSLKRSL